MHLNMRYLFFESNTINTGRCSGNLVKCFYLLILPGIMRIVTVRPKMAGYRLIVRYGKEYGNWFGEQKFYQRTGTAY